MQEHLARLRVIELLTGTHSRYLPEPLLLPRRRSRDYADLILTMPEQMALRLHQQARSQCCCPSLKIPTKAALVTPMRGVR